MQINLKNLKKWIICCITTGIAKLQIKLIIIKITCGTHLNRCLIFFALILISNLKLISQ